MAPKRGRRILRFTLLAGVLLLAIRGYDQMVAGMTRPPPNLIERLWSAVGLVSFRKYQSPALVIAASSEGPFPLIPPRAVIGPIRVYLAGFDEDGEVGALPFQAYPDACLHLSRLGSAVTPRDLTMGTGLTMELRITREGDRVRYQWGPDPSGMSGSAEPRLSWGEATFSGHELSAAGAGPLLPALADLIEERPPAGSPVVVFLSAGTGVRAVDYLRAVECGGGEPRVFFVPYPLERNTSSGQRPSSRSMPGAADILLESPDLNRVEGKVSFMTVDQGGTPHLRGMPFDLDRLAERIAIYQPAAVAIRGHPDARWAVCFRSFKAFLEVGADLYFILAPLDPVLGFDSLLHLPRAAKGETPVEVTLARRDGILIAPTEGVAGQPVRVRVPAGAKMEETLNSLIRLKMAGATGFEFE